MRALIAVATGRAEARERGLTVINAMASLMNHAAFALKHRRLAIELNPISARLCSVHSGRQYDFFAVPPLLFTFFFSALSLSVSFLSRRHVFVLILSEGGYECLAFPYARRTFKI